MQIFEFKHHSPPQVFLSVINNKGMVLGFKKLSEEEKKSVMAFNNADDEELKLCVDNQTDVVISIEMEIKYDHLLSNVHKLPTVDHY